MDKIKDNMKEEIENYLKGVEKITPVKKDHGLRYCTKCNHTWEYWWQSGNSFFQKYNHMPTYGKKRQLCNDCSGKPTNIKRSR